MQALFFDLPKMPELGNDDDMSCVQSDTGSIFLKPLKILQATQQINKTHALLQKKKKKTKHKTIPTVHASKNHPDKNNTIETTSNNLYHNQYNIKYNKNKQITLVISHNHSCYSTFN